MKILLAEDDIHISTIAKIALEKLGGHQVTVVNNGEDALQMALKGGFDLIMLDEMMPKLNGLAVCRRYKAEAKVQVPVIFLSAKSQESDIAEFNGLAAGYIAKPFEPMEINRQIQELLSEQKAAA